MDWPLVAASWGVSALLVLTPGMDWAYVISAGLARRSGMLPAVIGVLSGHTLATIAVAAGIAALVAASPITLIVLTFAGSGYIVWLGIQTFRHPPSSDLETLKLTVSHRMLFLKGLGLTLIGAEVWGG